MAKAHKAVESVGPAPVEAAGPAVNLYVKIQGQGMVPASKVEALTDQAAAFVSACEEAGLALKADVVSA